MRPHQVQSPFHGRYSKAPIVMAPNSKVPTLELPGIRGPNIDPQIVGLFTRRTLTKKDPKFIETATYASKFAGQMDRT